MSTGSKAGDIILNHVCPTLGVLFANYQNIAPLKDLDHAVKKGQGLNGLNPTPWIFMFGTTVAWTAYALLSNDYYLFFADCFGFLSAIWLNLGAVKLMYSDHYQLLTRKALVSHLQHNHVEVEQEKKSIIERSNKEKEEMRRTFAKEKWELRMSTIDAYDSEEDEKDDGEHSEPTSSTGTAQKKKGRARRSTVRFSEMLPRRSTISKTNDGEDNRDRRSTVRFSEMLPRRSTISKTNDGEDDRDRRSTVRFSEMFPRRSTISKTNDGEDDRDRRSKGRSTISTTNDDNDNEHSSSAGDPDNCYGSERSLRLSSVFPRGLSLKSLGSLGKMGSSSSLKRRERINNWADVVWNVTAQQKPAGASHEKLLVGTIAFWLVVFSILFFYSFHDDRKDRNYIPLEVVGYIGIFFQLFFYGAPLARISQVLKTKRCDCIHMHSLIGNTLNNSLWTGYGLSPRIRDPKIWGPCAVGLVFCAIQFFLCAIFPRSTESEKVAKRFSITSLLLSDGELDVEVRPSSTLGRDNAISEALKSIREYESGELSLADLERGTIEEGNEDEGSEYMTSFGHYSYLY